MILGSTPASQWEGLPFYQHHPGDINRLDRDTGITPTSFVRVQLAANLVAQTRPESGNHGGWSEDEGPLLESKFLGQVEVMIVGMVAAQANQSASWHR